MHLVCQTFLLILHLRIIESCPKICICKWKSGKEWVECVDRKLKELPQSIREETQVLDLSDNQLYAIKTDYFYVYRLINLQRLYLKNSKIHRIFIKAFSGLQGLVELDLSENELRLIPSEIFAPTINLVKLNLAGNPIEILYSNSFNNLGQLSFLDLSRCHISYIEAGAFTVFYALEWLHLNNNKLKTLSNNVLPFFPSLHGLSLDGNPWDCDCKLIPLLTWLEISQNKVPQQIDPICKEPLKLKNRLISSLKIQELACAPIITITGNSEINENENITLQCEVSATPRTFPKWFFNGTPLNSDFQPINLKKYQ